MNCDKLRNTLIEKGYKQEINKVIERTKTLNRKQLVKEKTKT